MMFHVFSPPYADPASKRKFPDWLVNEIKPGFIAHHRFIGQEAEDQARKFAAEYAEEGKS
jgi:hypothetical protein